MEKDLPRFDLKACEFFFYIFGLEIKWKEIKDDYEKEENSTNECLTDT